MCPCGRHADRHGGRLPELLEEDQEQEGEEEEVEEKEQLLCSHCGDDRPGPTPTYPWRKHHSTGARLCKECWLYQRKHDGFLPELPHQEPGSASMAPLVAAAAQAAAAATPAGRQRGRRQSRADASEDAAAAAQVASPRPQTTRRQQAGAAGPAAVPGGSRRHGRPPKRKLLPGDEGLPPPAKQLHRHQAQAPAGAAESPAAAEKGHLDLLDLLVEASNLPAAAAAGLGGELVGGFWALMLTLSPEQQAARVGACRNVIRKCACLTCTRPGPC